MENQTKTFKTKGGVSLQCKPYITGGDWQEFRKAVYGEMGENKTVSYSFLIEREKQMIEYAIVSVNGKTENVLETILGLPKDDYEEIIEYLADNFFKSGSRSGIPKES